MFAPMRLVIDAEDKAKSVFQREGDTAAISEVTLDNNRVFKAKAEKRFVNRFFIFKEAMEMVLLT